MNNCKYSRCQPIILKRCYYPRMWPVHIDEVDARRQYIFDYQKREVRKCRQTMTEVPFCGVHNCYLLFGIKCHRDSFDIVMACHEVVRETDESK